MKGRCCTCKNWSISEGWEPYKYHRACKCKLFLNENDFRDEEPSSETVLIEDDFNIRSEVYTGADFGCIHHTPLPDGETK